VEVPATCTAQHAAIIGAKTVQAELRLALVHLPLLDTPVTLSKAVVNRGSTRVNLGQQPKMIATSPGKAKVAQLEVPLAVVQKVGQLQQQAGQQQQQQQQQQHLSAVSCCSKHDRRFESFCSISGWQAFAGEPHMVQCCYHMRL
jgi:hypothetical protein